MKKLLALLLALCMLLSMAACADNSTDDEDETKAKRKTKATQSQDKDDEDEPDNDKDDQDDKDDEDDQDGDGNEALREGLNVYEYQGLRFYLGDELDEPEDGWTANDDFDFRVESFSPDELEENFGEGIDSGDALLDSAIDLLESDDATIHDSGKKNGNCFIYAEYEEYDEQAVFGFYYKDGCAWIVNIYLEDDDKLEDALKYATICEVVGLPEQDDDDDDGDDEDYNAEAPDAEDVIASFSNGDCAIMICDFETSDFYGSTAKVYLQNNSNKTLLFVSDLAIIDGLSCGSNLYMTLQPGQSYYDEVYIDSPIPVGEDDLLYTDISIAFRVREEGNYTDDALEQTLRFYPMGENNATQYVRDIQDTDLLLLDNQYATIYLISSEIDDLWGYEGQLYIINKTDYVLDFYHGDATVNGKDADVIFLPTVLAHCSCYDELWFSSFEDLNITEVEEIEVTIIAYNGDMMYGNTLFEETVTFNP